MHQHGRTGHVARRLRPRHGRNLFFFFLNTAAGGSAASTMVLIIAVEPEQEEYTRCEPEIKLVQCSKRCRFPCLYFNVKLNERFLCELIPMLAAGLMLILFGSSYMGVLGVGTTLTYFFSAVAVFFFAIYLTYRWCLSFADS